MYSLFIKQFVYYVALRVVRGLGHEPLKSTTWMAPPNKVVTDKSKILQK